MLTLSRSWVGVSATLLLLASCGKDATEQSDGGAQPSRAQPLAVIVSDVVIIQHPPTDASIGKSVRPGPFGSVAYVSLPPSTVPHGAVVGVRNLVNNDTVTAPLTDGGLDPVRVAAQAGDTLRIWATDSAGNRYEDLAAMRERVRPRVVRTVPAAHKTDVPLNARIQVVFSEPVAITDPSQVRLRRNGTVVAGMVPLIPVGSTTVEFVPAVELAPSTAYVLEIEGSVADLDGDALTDMVSIPFTTASEDSGTPGRAVRLAFSSEIVNTLVGLPMYHVDVVAVDKFGNITAILDGPISIALGANPGGGTLSGETTDTRGFFSFRSLHIDRVGNGYTLVATAPGLPAATSTPFNVVPATDLIALGSTEGLLLADGGGNGMSVLAQGGFGWDPAWSPDKQQVVYGAFLGSTADGSDLYRIGVDGSGWVRLTSGWFADSPTWSPDGRKIAFASSRDGGTDIYVMNADGTGVSRLTSDRTSLSPAWSPDGQTIVFADTAGGVSAIYTMSASGTGIARLTSGRPASGPAWSPDGTRIVYSSKSDVLTAALYVMLADGSQAAPLTPSQPDVLDYQASWSPDGSRIVFTRQIFADMSESGDVYVMNADGSGATVLIPRVVNLFSPGTTWYAKGSSSWSR